MAKYLDIEKFIEAIRVRPPLWNKFVPMHRNSELTSSLWNAVRDEIGGDITVPELKQKWHNLRDCFRREERTARIGKKKRKWVHYNQMLFLLTPYDNLSDENTPNSIESITMLDLPVKVETSDEALELDVNNGHSDYRDFIENDNFSDEIMNEQSYIRERRKTEEDRLSSKSSQIESNDSAVISQSDDIKERGKCIRAPTQNEQVSKNDNFMGAGEFSRRDEVASDNDDYHFAMSIIPQMRQVPIHRKLRMRIRISEIIAQEAGYDEIS